MVDIGHVTMLMLSTWMFVLMRMHRCSLVMLMKFIMVMSVFVHYRHVDVKMRMLFVCQQERACNHQSCGNTK